MKSNITNLSVITHSPLYSLSCFIHPYTCAYQPFFVGFNISSLSMFIVTHLKVVTTNIHYKKFLSYTIPIPFLGSRDMVLIIFCKNKPSFFCSSFVLIQIHYSILRILPFQTIPLKIIITNIHTDSMDFLYNSHLGISFIKPFYLRHISLILMNKKVF
jgi:hypothetical protein